MKLYRVHLNPRCKKARGDLSDPYKMHATLSRLFAPSSDKIQPGLFLWRLEPECSKDGFAKVLIQSKTEPVWDRIATPDWFAKPPDEGLDHLALLGSEAAFQNRNYRFRLRGNPCVTRKGKRLGLLENQKQMEWMQRKAKSNGFNLVSLVTSSEQFLRGKKVNGTIISIYSVLFEGILTIADAEMFKNALIKGIGHGKSLGLGMLSIAPANRD